MTTSEDHEHLRALVAEYDLGRLTPDERRRVEEHLAGCPACAELAADVKLIRQQVQDVGKAMFDPHPEPAALRAFASGGPEPDSRIVRHLRACAVCRLEVETWKSRPAALPPAASGAWWTRTGLAAAAAALFGIAVGWLLHTASVPVAVPGGGEPRETEKAQAPLAVQAPVLHLLPGLLRSGEPPKQQWTLDSGEASVGVAVPLTVPSSASDIDRYRFEIRRADGDLAWSQEMTAERTRAHLEAAEVVNLMVVTAQPLAAGDYEFRVVPGAGEGAPIYRARITIAYRQSPAATKAPQ